MKRLLRIPFQLFRRARQNSKARTEIAKLKSNESTIIRAIAEGLSEASASSFSREEQTLLDSIEKRRSSLLGSTREIGVIDFGAGSPDSNRGIEEMESGVESTAQVAKICRASKPAFWAVVLFKLIRKLKPASCVELGTCVGISASYQAAAMKLNGDGFLRTLEGSPEVAKIAAETLSGLDLENAEVVTGPFHYTLDSVLKQSAPIDFFFNDGHHDHDAVIRYFNEAIPFLANDAVVMFDDISWSEGMKKAWLEIQKDKRVSATIDLGPVGIAVLGTKSADSFNVAIPLLPPV